MERRVVVGRAAREPGGPGRDVGRAEILEHEAVPAVDVKGAEERRRPRPDASPEGAIGALFVRDAPDDGAPLWQRIRRLEERATPIPEHEPERGGRRVPAVHALGARDGRAEAPGDLRLPGARDRRAGSLRRSLGTPGPRSSPPLAP